MFHLSIIHSQISEPNTVVDSTIESTVSAVTVTWKKPEGKLTGYRVKISPSHAKNSTLKIKDVNATSAEFEGLKPNKEYKVEIVTISGDEESEKVNLEDKTSK